MSLYLDTSALAKLYHLEIGTLFVKGLISSGQYMSPGLPYSKIHSVFAGKVRTGALTQIQADLAWRRFRSDVRQRRFRIVTLRVRHYEVAGKMIAAHGVVCALRTLDSLQGALELARSGLVSAIVTADRTMLRVAAIEGLAGINPETAGAQVDTSIRPRGERSVDWKSRFQL